MYASGITKETSLTQHTQLFCSLDLSHRVKVTSATYHVPSSPCVRFAKDSVVHSPGITRARLPPHSVALKLKICVTDNIQPLAFVTRQSARTVKWTPARHTGVRKIEKDKYLEVQMLHYDHALYLTARRAYFSA